MAPPDSRKGIAMRPSGRKLDEMRRVAIEPDALKHAEGSCLVTFGETRVICAASVMSKLPPFRKNTGLGWITAEYAMLPRATASRTRREATTGRQTGRTQEIQRLIGRSLRASVDLAALGEIQIHIDCDVVNADGGTRCASVTGGWVALRRAVNALMKSGKVKRDPFLDHVAAVSCGVYCGQIVLDMDYAEDFDAETDANFVLTGNGRLVEVQCTAEAEPFTEQTLTELVGLARKGVEELVAVQRDAAGS